MRPSLLPTGVLAILSVAVHGLRIIQGNDDGWAELYVRALHDELLAAGHDTVLSAPADNMSGTGTSSLHTLNTHTHIDPIDRLIPCEYSSCPAFSGPAGSNTTNPRLNWVNSFPATALRYGIDTFGPQLWPNNAAAELAITGPISGTIGAAAYAAHTARIPAIAFSGASEDKAAWDTEPAPPAGGVYAQLAATLVDALVAAGPPPYLPDDVFLNVNFPAVEGDCTDVGRFRWAASRIRPGAVSPPDAETCGGSERLPTETAVLGAEGCFISVSFGDGGDKTDTSADKQAVVVQKLASLWTCLP